MTFPLHDLTHLPSRRGGAMSSSDSVFVCGATPHRWYHGRWTVSEGSYSYPSSRQLGRYKRASEIVSIVITADWNILKCKDPHIGHDNDMRMLRRYDSFESS